MQEHLLKADSGDKAYQSIREAMEHSELVCGTEKSPTHFGDKRKEKTE